MTAIIYPASLPMKANGFRYQGWCHEHQDGQNAKTKAQAKKWCVEHNNVEHADGQDSTQQPEVASNGAR